MPGKQGKDQYTIATHRPGLVEGLTDATLGAAIRQIERARGSSEREAYGRASDVMNNLETLTGLRALEGSAKRAITGRGSAGDYIATGLAALPIVGRLPFARRAALAADEALMGQRVSNRVVPEPNPTAKPTIFDRRPLISADQVTHAQRKISTAELMDAVKHGEFRVPEKGTRFSTGEKPQKWWSAADEEGQFGRPWDRANTHVVRLPVGKVPSTRAASTKYAEVYDPTAGSWVPFGTYIKKYAIGGTVIDDGDPAKQRKLI